jgi:predicted negative regulator of RcsB-dependent stress response
LGPDPDYYLERAQAQAAAGPVSVDASLRGLDEGLALLGPVVSLQLAAIDLAVNAKRYDAALARLDRILEHAPRKEEWLARRGDILRAAGRRDEAHLAYQAALSAIVMLPAERQTAATTRLAVRLRSEIERREGRK